MSKSLTPREIAEELASCAEPLWGAEACLEPLERKIKVGALVLHADDEQVERLMHGAARIHRALEDFHRLAADVAKSKGVDMDLINQASARSGGNKTDPE